MIEYIFLAIIHGLIEWLPISSSGQVMIIAINIFGISPENAFSLAIWLRLGTTFAVLLRFRDDYVNIVKSCAPKLFKVEEIDIKKKNWIIYSTIGTAITALPLYLVFTFVIGNAFTGTQGDLITLIISGMLVVTGVILLKTKKDYGNFEINEVSKEDLKKDSIFAGLVQGISVLPGISRSGVTVSAILLEKYDQKSALKLSFLISVPAALASIVVDVIFGNGSVVGILDPITILIITLISFGVGYLFMEILLKVAEKINFGYFCVFYGIISLGVLIPFIITSFV